MAFSLIEQSAGAVPIVAIDKDRLPGWLDEAPERERNWVTSLGFSAEAGKHVVLPDDTGRLARVLVGLGDADAEGTMWALAGLPEALPEGSYRLVAAGNGVDPTRLALGWALAAYSFTRYSAKPRPAAALVWPEGPIAAVSSGWPARCSSPVTWLTRRPAISGRRSWPAKRCGSPRPPAPGTASSSATT